MKQRFSGVVAVLLLLLATGCNSEYQERIDKMNELADSLEEQCAQFNRNIDAYSKLIKAIHEGDLITGTSKIRDDNNNDVGYTINFASREPISVYFGKDGYSLVQPVSSDGVPCWAVQYGIDGPVEYLLDKDGNKIPVSGNPPFLSIKDDIWGYSYSSGSDWMPLGPAKGDDADSLFEDIDDSDPLFVVFKMSDGSVLKVPKYKAFSALRDSVSAANENIRAQKYLLDAMLGGAVCITSIEDQNSGGGKTGVKVTLSDGNSFVISDWVKSPVPLVMAEKDTSDGVFYWTCRYDGGDPVWITDADGEKIRAVASVPVVSIGEKEGNYYWYVTFGGEGHFVLDTDGNEIAVSDNSAFAADSVQYRIFKSVVYDEDCLEILLNNGEGTSIRLMRRFAVTLLSPHLSGRTLDIPEGQVDTVRFSATGSDVKDMVVMKEGELSADADLEKSSIYIKKKTSAGGSVSLIFTLSDVNSTNTKFIKLQVK